MDANYNPQDIEAKWQKRWTDAKLFETEAEPGRPKYYVLEMLPYPSGDIHMGHVRNYSIGDALARYMWMKGFYILHPIGWDAFGLPAENAAIKHQRHPSEFTFSYIERMRGQLQRLGISYDWRREIATCVPEYYRWNQWFFLKMFERGLAYRKKSRVNWCPQCETVLANEQVVNGCCWRHEETPVIERELEQWFLKTTDYAEQLLDDMKMLVRWPERVLTMQQNWIGKSAGTFVDFTVNDLWKPLRIFTTRVDTIYGCSAVFLAPDHPLVEELLKNSQEPARLRDEVERIKFSSIRARVEIDMVKLGAPTGFTARNPCVQRGIGSDLACQLRADGLRYRRHYRRYRPTTNAILNSARLMACPFAPVIVPEGWSGGGEWWCRALSAMVDYGRLVQNSGLYTGLKSGRGSDRAHDPRCRDRGLRQRHGSVPPEGLGNLTAALLGHAHPYHLLRQVRNCAGSGRRPASAAASQRQADRAGPFASRGRAGICEYDLPKMPGAGEDAETEYHGHFR